MARFRTLKTPIFGTASARAGIRASKDANSLYICASDSDHIEVLGPRQRQDARVYLAERRKTRSISRSIPPAQCSMSPTRTKPRNHRRIGRGQVVTEIPGSGSARRGGHQPTGGNLVKLSGNDKHGACHRPRPRARLSPNILVDSRPRRALWTTDGAQFGCFGRNWRGRSSVVDRRKNAKIVERHHLRRSRVTDRSDPAVGNRPSPRDRSSPLSRSAGQPRCRHRRAEL